MKRPIILALAAFCFTATTLKATPIIPFDVAYFTTNYAASPSTNSTADLASGLWLGNLRGRDTWRDLIVANTGSNSVSVRLCNDDGTFRALTNYAVGASPTAVKSQDLNSDGFEDIVVANSGTNTITVLLNSAAGTIFTNVSEYVVGSTSTPEPTAVAMGDANSDGWPDILVVNALEDSVTVLTNVGNGTFVAWTDFPVGTGPRSIFYSDFNGDGYSDILTANKTAGTLTILYKQFGVFTTTQTITLFSGGDPQPVSALADDLNSDGYKDIVTANYASNSVSILLNNGAGSFSIATNYDVGTGPISLLVRDLNSDNVPDIAVANEGSGTVDVLLNEGNATFATGYNFSVGSSPSAIAGSNFDPGNLNDLAVANNGDNTVSILLYSMPLVQPLSYTLLEDSNKVCELTASVFPGRTATFTIVSGPTNGTVTGTSPNFTYTPDTNFFGDDSFTFQASDGFDLSEETTVTLHVLPVNDPPTFTVATNEIMISKFSVLTTITNFISDSSPGPDNETNQTVSFVTTTTNTAFFTSQPQVTRYGKLTFKVSPNAVGTNTIAIRAMDNGGLNFGGTNMSSATEVSIIAPPNPFTSASGLYNGLFYQTNEVTYDSAGFVRLVLKTNGYFSGKVVLGKGYSFSKQFDTQGHVQFSVNRTTNLPPLLLDLSFISTNQQITGTVSDGTWTAALLADFAPYSALTNPAPQEGRYTLAFNGSNDSSTSPGGNSYGALTIDGSGKVKVVGMLADRRGFSQVANISANGEWPLYVPLNSSNRIMISWITFTNQTNSSLTGNLTWIKGLIPADMFYPAGFTNQAVVTGSTYVAPTTERVLNLTNAITILSQAMLPISLTNSVTLTSTNTFMVTGGDASKLVLKVNLLNGCLSGSFLHPVTLRSSGIRGVVLQQQIAAQGMFFTTNQSGSFVLTP